MPNLPKRKATAPAGGSSTQGSSSCSTGRPTTKKSTSSKPHGTASSATIGQGGQTSLNAFLTKVRPHDADTKGTPSQSTFPSNSSKPSATAASSATSSTVASAAPSITSIASTSRISGSLKAPRRIIIDDDEDDMSIPVRVKAKGVARPLRRPLSDISTYVAPVRKQQSEVSKDSIPLSIRRPKEENRDKSTSLSRRPRTSDDTLPFEQRMPVSPPDSPALSAIVKQLEESEQEISAMNQRLQGSSPLEAGSEAGTSSSSTSHIATTPPKSTKSHANITPQRPKRRHSPVRTPTRKSRSSVVPLESLGLSPEDSVFWARTPPSETWKKLRSMNTGRSHEEEVASIVGRLYETSSAGTSLKTMSRKPKDHIRDMLDIIRGSTTGSEPEQDGDDDDDFDRWDPSSPTKELVNRQRNSAALQHSSLSRHHSAQELRMNTRKRRRGVRTTPNFSPLNSDQAGSPSKCREDVLKMIEQIQANMTGPSMPKPMATEQSSQSRRIIMDEEDNTQISLGTTALHHTPPPKTANKQMTPVKNHAAQASPGEFDDFLSDLDMDDNDYQELTQFELSSTSMSSAVSNTTALPSCSFSSAASSSDKSLSGVRKGFSSLDVDTSFEGSVVDTHGHKGNTLDVVEELSQELNSGSLSDDFNDIGDLGDDFNFENEHDIKPSIAPHIQTEKYARYCVNEVKENVIDPRWSDLCKVLMVQGNKGDYARIILRQSWAQTIVAPGDKVHIISANVYPGTMPDFMLEDAQGFIIVKPDYLIQTSVLAESFRCIRKPIIDIRARKTDEATAPLVHGTMLHELFQGSLFANDFSTASLQSKIEDVIAAHVNDLYLINETNDSAREVISQYISSCQDWARRYLRASPSTDGTIVDAMGQTASGESSLLCVNKILDIEENIWSPMFGLKGKIDASIQVVVKTDRKKPGSDDCESKTLTVPFELKTGKKSNVVSHRAQTMLYTLLMTDRYDVNVNWGLLFYLKTGEFIRVPALHDEIRTILMQRNEIAIYEEAKLTLPPMIQRTDTCSYCFSFSSCTVLHKLLEDGTAETAGLGMMFEERTDHLNDTHAAFLKKWNRLLALEQGDVAKFQSQIWSMLSADRQAAGNCFNNLVMVEESGADAIAHNDTDFSTSGRFASHRYRFRLGASMSLVSQQTLSQTIRGGNSFLSSNITVGDPIVVSSDSQHYALAIGTVIDLSPSEIIVGLDRPLSGPPMRLLGYDQERNQSFRGLIDIEELPLPIVQRDAANYHAHLKRNNVTFRIDKDEMMAGLARTRNNLVQLFRADADGGDFKRRHLIVDLEKPKFDPLQDLEGDHQNLNEDQKQAISTVLAARDYALILGMPGTGKTTTIAQIIHTLAARGKTVLLTSYTHSAVDNVLLKLGTDLNIIRLGNRDKVHRDIQNRVPDFTQAPLNTVEAIQKFYDGCQVVGTTCLGVGDPLFTRKVFDYCIVDEASQITLPACLGPIRYADVFVLVGDHNQLPPLVKNVEAKKDGLDLSLFKMLSDQYPEAVVSLTHQYRMNKDIMLLCNTLVYENRLKCASDDVANKVLKIPDMKRFRQYAHPEYESNPFAQDNDSSMELSQMCHGHSAANPCWLEQALDPRRSVIFIDTDNVPAHEVQVGNSTQNPTEALLVRQLTEALIQSGVAENDIGVISVLRAQLKVLSRYLRPWPLLDIHTVDRYQGKDKECVIVSLVRSNAEQHVGELLKDWRRINVAFTRAKTKLVVFGSRQTLQGSPIFERFLKLTEQQDWVLRITPGSQHQHPALSRSPLQPRQKNVRRTMLLERLLGECGENSDKENALDRHQQQIKINGVSLPKDQPARSNIVFQGNLA
ncbi:Tripartite DNA replication factor [Mortierella polycephala]|uniref:DNA replication ATP-dependent helicase/nuclease DNA2 n=1 Tax=Mortierella polycephala TaxID=41804 RepID=A0A9P6U2Y8_9FUNG|nr:Tripartite DNA replication factor [Mortierella polycephala]